MPAVTGTAASSASWWPAAASAVGNIASSAIGAISQNNMNLANRTWSAQQAQLNRDFQVQQQLQVEQYNKDMSDTAIQRRMADLKASGVNPMLGITTLGGASSPTAPMAPGSMANTPNTQAPFSGQTQAQAGNAIQSGLQAALTMAQTRDTAASASNKEATNPYAAAQAKAQVDQLQASAADLKADADDLGQKYYLDQANWRKVMQDKQFQFDMQPLLIRAQELANQGAAYGLTKEKLLSDFYQTGVGRLVGQMEAVRAGGGEPAALIYGGAKGLTDSLRSSAGAQIGAALGGP